MEQARQKAIEAFAVKWEREFWRNEKLKEKARVLRRKEQARIKKLVTNKKGK